MSNADIRGRFVWHELMTTDPDAAAAFYSKVVPWKTQPSGMPSYTLWMSGKTQAGGLMELPSDAKASGTPPNWLIYVATPSVDSTVEAAQRLGGKVFKPASDIPNVGRFAVLSDPQGVAFAVFTPAPGSKEGGGAGAPGDFTWHELATTDPEGAMRFYSELFGWGRGAAHDMGGMGVYHLISHGGQDVGGIYKVHDASTPPNWLSYVRVNDAAKAATAVKGAGGRVLHGPTEVPGGSWIVQLLDPQGGAFAVVEAPRAAAKPAAQKSPPAKAAEPAKAAAAAAKPAASAAAPAASAPARKPAKKAARKKTAGKKAAGKKAAGKKAAGKKAARKSAPKKGSASRKGKSAAAKSAKRGKGAARARAKAKKRR